MTIPTNAKPLVLRDYEAQALASGRMGAIVRVVPERLLDKYYDYDDWCNAVIPAGIPCTRDYEKSFFLNHSPYRPGDTLWGKETYNPDWCDHAIYKADGGSAKAAGYASEPKWRSPVTMPREACRHILRVKSVEVCRVKDVGYEEAEQMGIELHFNEYETNNGGLLGVGVQLDKPKMIGDLRKMWDSTIKPADRAKFGYEANPWVWFVMVEGVGE